MEFLPQFFIRKKLIHLLVEHTTGCLILVGLYFVVVAGILEDELALVLQLFRAQKEIAIPYLSLDIEQANRILHHFPILGLLVWVQTSFPEPVFEDSLLVFVHQPFHQLLLELDADPLPTHDTAVGVTRDLAALPRHQLTKVVLARVTDHPITLHVNLHVAELTLEHV